MNKLQKMTLCFIMVFIGLTSITYAQKVDVLFKTIEQRKSYIFARYLEQPSQSILLGSQFTFLKSNLFHQEELPIFCKMEFLIKQNSQIPVKIRLGDIEYVDMLESKSIIKH